MAYTVNFGHCAFLSDMTIFCQLIFPGNFIQNSTLCSDLLNMQRHVKNGSWLLRHGVVAPRRNKWRESQHRLVSVCKHCFHAYVHVLKIIVCNSNSSAIFLTVGD